MIGRIGKRQVATAAGVALGTAAAKERKRLRLPAAVATACWFSAVPLIALGFRSSKARDSAIWIGQMLAYKNAFEMPNDDPERLRQRTHVDYPIRVDSLLAGGSPLGERLQRRLRRRGYLSLTDKLLTFLYWSWEIEPHIAVAWIRWRHPDRFISA